MTNASQAPGLSPGLSFGPGAVGPTPAPIHDIVGPIPFFSGPLWVILVVLLAVVLTAALCWWFFGRKKVVSVTPREAALGALARLRGTVSQGSDHEFGVGVSDVLRRFLGRHWALRLRARPPRSFWFPFRVRSDLFLPSRKPLPNFYTNPTT